MLVLSFFHAVAGVATYKETCLSHYMTNECI